MTKKLNKIIVGLSVALIMMIGTTQSVKANQNSSTEQIQGTTITKEIEGELKKVKEERKLKWTQMDLNLDAKSAKISNKKSSEEVKDEIKKDPEEVTPEVKKADISVEKSSKLTKLKENTHSDVAEYGDTIKYTIKVTNKGNAAGTATVKDTVPEGTTLLSYDTETTNLGIEEYNQLASKEGLSKELEIEANSTKTIEFTVKVTGGAGTKISNNATYKTPEKEENAKDPTEYLIGKEIKITKNTENIKTTNSNVVLVMDVSGSMADNNRLKNAKEAAKKLIDGVDFTSGGQIGIITFSSGEKVNGSTNWNVDNAKSLKVSGSKEYATNLQEATSLKNSVESLKANGGTRIAAGLSKAKTMIEIMAAQDPKNANIVIVLSDGAYSVEKNPNGADGDVLINTGNETVSRVKTSANALKAGTAKPKVYTIAVLSSANETPGNTSIMTEIIPSSKSNYIKATDGYENLINAFKKIESSISGGATKTVVSKDGMVELDEVKSIDSIIIKVNGKNVSDIKTHLKEQSGKTFMDLSTFDTNAKIEVEYTAN